MSVEKIAAPEEKFSEELIKRFFHPQSYFYYCLQNSLKSDSALMKQFDSCVSEIIIKLIDFLIHSKNAIDELKEISHVKKFMNFYDCLKDELSRANLPSLDNTTTKRAIHHLASSTLENLFKVFSIEHNRIILQSYLDLKMRLRTLLDQSNGNSKNIAIKLMDDLSASSFVDGEKADLIDQTSILAEIFISGQQEENLAFQKFLDQEIQLILKPITKANDDQKLAPSFLKISAEIFEKLAELGRFHNNHELIVISEKILLLLQATQGLPLSETKAIADLIVAGHDAIQHFIFYHRTPEELDQFLKKYDDFLAHVGLCWQDGFKTEAKRKLKELSLEKENLDDGAERSAESASTIKNLPLHRNAENEKAKQNFINTNLKKDALQVKPVVEEDEDLMDLIKEISTSMAATSHQEDGTINPGDTSFEKDEARAQNKDDYSTEIFYKEGLLFIQVILNAIERLKEQANDSSPLEDIELASSSLKILANKCYFEKIAFLPELIESICIKVKKINQPLPQPILDKIKESVLLLKEFDPTDEGDESKLQVIVSALRTYYSDTIIALEETSHPE